MYGLSAAAASARRGRSRLLLQCGTGRRTVARCPVSRRPDALGALAELHERDGTRTLADLWRPAVEAAERGVACSVKTRDDVRTKRDWLSGDAGLAAMFLPGGEVPRPGQQLRYPEFARSISILAKDPMSLYRGEFAERALAALTEAGAPFSGAEWELAARPESVPSICSRYRGMTVHQTPLPTPSWMVLQQLALCEGDLAGMPYLGVDAVHRMAAVARRSFADRWERCASDNDAGQDLLDPDAVAKARVELDEEALAPVAGVWPDGDTTSTVAVDGEGRSVSFIHSLAFTFGACVSIPGTGIALNNRLGSGAYLVPGHAKEVCPRRKPLHTLNAWIVTDDENRLRHVGNTPGGDGQVQWNVQLLSHLLDYGRSPQDAVSAPRFTVYPGSDADTIGHAPELRLESRFGDSVVDGLRQHGHEVGELGSWDAGGSALVVSRDPETGSLAGGADPRQEGVVLGE